MNAMKRALAPTYSTGPRTQPSDVVTNQFLHELLTKKYNATLAPAPTYVGEEPPAPPRPPRVRARTCDWSVVRMYPRSLRLIGPS
eukprot:5345369-Pyramimonas_sp.AAC.1